jgi:Transposase DDE domain group 1
MSASGPKAYTIRGGDSMPAEMVNPLYLAPVADKATLVDFDGGRLSSDGGRILFNDPDDQRGFTRDVAAVLRDRRDPRRVHFTLHDLLKQRVWQIASGYEDANDANTLRHDPIFKLLLGRLPDSGPPWPPPRTASTRALS